MCIGYMRPSIGCYVATGIGSLLTAAGGGLAVVKGHRLAKNDDLLKKVGGIALGIIGSTALYLSSAALLTLMIPAIHPTTRFITATIISIAVSVLLERRLG